LVRLIASLSPKRPTNHFAHDGLSGFPSR
jgi:hypothetical protein